MGLSDWKVKDPFMIQSDAWIQRETAGDIELIRQRQGDQISATRDVTRAVERGIDGNVRTAEGIQSSFAALGSSIEASLASQADYIAARIDVGLESVVRSLAHQTDELVRRLDSPQHTASLEKKRDGIRAFERRGYGPEWVEGALADFEEATHLDRYDYESYWYLGMLHMFSRFDDERAKSAFAQSAAYAWPDYPEESSASLLACALVEAANKQYSRARDLATLAVERAPSLAVARFDLARYQAATGNCSDSVVSLRAAIGLDPELFDKARVAADFKGGCAPEVDQLLDEMLFDETAKAYERLTLAQRWVNGTHSILSKANIEMSDDRGSRLQDLESLMMNGGYANYRQIGGLAADIASSVRQSADDRLRELIRDTEPGANPAGPMWKQVGRVLWLPVGMALVRLLGYWPLSLIGGLVIMSQVYFSQYYGDLWTSLLSAAGAIFAISYVWSLLAFLREERERTDKREYQARIRRHPVIRQARQEFYELARVLEPATGG